MSTATTRKNPIRYRRGKRMPRILRGDVIDLTTWPLHSRPMDRGPVELCTRCGRKGERTRYTNGQTQYAHVVRFGGLFWSVDDSCYVASAPL